MSRIDGAFSSPGRKALVAYVTVGYPSGAATETVVPALAEAGCSIVELGIPFSDPLADGTTIQEASFRALRAGVTPESCLEIAGRIRRKTDVPLVFMTYYNPVLQYGVGAFADACASSGVDGLIVPDLPPEEAEALDATVRKRGLDLIYLLSPASAPERTRLVTASSRGFVYLVSLLGVTGARDSLPAGLEEFVGRVRRETEKPLCVGFGISTPEEARRVSRVADGVIIGSRLVQLMRDDELPYTRVVEFVREVRMALDR